MIGDTLRDETIYLAMAHHQLDLQGDQKAALSEREKPFDIAH